MTTAEFSVFFAVLSLACWTGTVIALVSWFVAWRRPASLAGEVVANVRASALWLAWIVAIVTTLGSLYYSLIAHFEPCELCWYQRICMYPLSAILLIAAIRGDRSVRLYVLPQCVVGVVIAAYHTQLQAFPKQQTFCSLSNPCTVRYVWEFGFVSLPFMSLAAFCFIITMVLLGGVRQQVADDDDQTVHSDAQSGDDASDDQDDASDERNNGQMIAGSVHATDPERVL